MKLFKTLTKMGYYIFKVDFVAIKIYNFMILIALILIIFGVTLLMSNLGIIPGQVWSVIWPLVIIGLGLYVAIVAHMFHQFLDRIWKFIDKVEERLLHPFESSEKR